MGLGGHDSDRRVGGDPRGRPADLARVDERRDHRPRRRRAASTAPRRRTRSRARRSPDLVEKASAEPEGKTVNIGARNDAYGTGLADTFSEAWEAAGGTIGETVVYDPEQPNYDSEAEQIVSGNPDAIVIIDFPETFAKVGPALVRTGTSTRRRRSSPTV